MSAGDGSLAPRSDRDDQERRARRENARHKRIRARRRVAILGSVALASLLAFLVASLSGGERGSTAAKLASRVGAVRPIAPQTRSSPAPARARVVSPPAGSLPQTHVYPSDRSERFMARMASLWAGIVNDSLAPALPAFFPKGAYVQLKAIASASSDWRERLVHDYRIDIDAAHALLGSSAARAQLIAVNATSSYGHWVSPGVCDNGIGYYEMPNARIVYRLDGQTRSFGIASMISWRGEWYVVHLGAILRAEDTGAVDEPASGPGASAYSSTC
jgi:hypothetical protein